MPKNRPLDNSCPESIEEAWAAEGEIAATKAIIRKYARVLDMTDSGRDIKPLASGMFDAIDRLKTLEAAEASSGSSPLATILAEAEAVLANA